MREFNNKLLDNSHAIKRAFSGATASQLNIYVQATLKEDKPDTIIINAGTNNFTKKRQSIEETVAEIMEIVKTCKHGGVKRIFVSSITCRPQFQAKIDEINELLEYNAGIFNYVFINNASIREEHLRNDGVHLNNDGVYKLANNFLSCLNRPSLSHFSSIWD